MKEPWNEVASMSFIQVYISLSKTIVIIIHICPLVVTNQSAGIDKYSGTTYKTCRKSMDQHQAHVLIIKPKFLSRFSRKQPQQQQKEVNKSINAILQFQSLHEIVLAVFSKLNKLKQAINFKIYSLFFQRSEICRLLMPYSGDKCVPFRDVNHP